MRIVSLLPAATEILWFCGLGSDVVGVTYECAEPPEAALLPHVTNTIIPTGSTPAEIDRVINAAVASGSELYVLDQGLLADLDPQLIISQDLCRVCALPAGTVEEALALLGCNSASLQYNPMTLEDVLAGIQEIGSAGGAPERAKRQVARLLSRLADISAAVASQSRPKVLLLEWVDPPFSAGHWIPDQIVAAGGDPVLGHPGQRSGPIEWSAVAESGAEVLFVAPCGFDAKAAEAQLETVVNRPELADLPAVRNQRCHALDGDGLIVRPGPRLVDGVAELARLIHPTAAIPSNTDPVNTDPVNRL